MTSRPTIKQSQLLKKTIFSALFLALALVLPFLTGQIQTIGKMLSPMHLPVMLCGFVCGPFWGAAVGFIAPLLRSVLFTMPPMFPTALSMAFELMTYGIACALLYRILPKNIGFTYVSLVSAMVAGRLVWGLVMLSITMMGFGSFTFQAFLTIGVINAIPGIILQLVLIPPLIHVFKKLKYIL